ncbi:TOMM precursor leader peptide-binding protein [Halosquirtibacter xylanolyticus]|uniref:TOMM precursor leader peptide-binding protein n=1 Tax=Halosquirtibacter xylanolyticus TaxID=3374599 RepID=UPI003748C9C8|nr:TOMM precursor leader peptide-binding protein [Prolixibacteraceae bacterium]
MMNKYDIFKDETHQCYQLRTKTQTYLLEFDEEEKEKIFLDIVQELQNKPSLNLKALKGKLSKTHQDDAKILEVLSILKEYQLLSYEMMTDLDPTSTEAEYIPNGTHDKKLAIIGEGDITDKIKRLAKEHKFKSIKTFDYSPKQKIENIINEFDFILVDASHWSPFHLEQINKFALKSHTPWLFIGGIEEMSLKIGPLFYGKETGCYECLISRYKSAHDYPDYLSSYETHLKTHQKGSVREQIPNMLIAENIIANIAMTEVLNFFDTWALPNTWRNIIDINFMTLQSEHHALLKKPYCESCKPELKYNTAPWLEPITLK